MINCGRSAALLAFVKSKQSGMKVLSSELRTGSALYCLIFTKDDEHVSLSFAVARSAALLFQQIFQLPAGSCF
jgi:hypothetical protein